MRKYKLDPALMPEPNGRVTIFDEPRAKYMLYRDDSLDKATKLKTFKLDTVRKMAKSGSQIRKEQELIQDK